MNWVDFFHMGGHAFYVWMSYGMGLAVVVFLLLEPKFRLQSVQQKLKALYRREQLDRAEK